MPLESITAIICRGHRGASGTGPNFGNTCEGGSIRAQDPEFKKQGLDLRAYLGGAPFWGTMNCYIGLHAIDPMRYIENIAAQPQDFPPDRTFDPAATRWDYGLTNVKWHDNFAAETIFLLKAHIKVHGQAYPCFIHFPDPSTKPNNPVPHTIIEIIARPLPFNGDIYGQSVELMFTDGAVPLRLPLVQKALA